MDGFDLTWAPDGHRMVGTSLPIDGKVIVRTVNLDTGHATTIPESDGLAEPRWSPDGRYIAACCGAEEHLKIFDFKAQQWSELRNNGWVDSPEWSADGQFRCGAYLALRGIPCLSRQNPPIPASPKSRLPSTGPARGR